MKFSTSAVFLSLAGLVASVSIEKRNCPQGAHFGALSAFPNTVSPGDSITVSVNLNCPIEQFGIVPQFLDYTIENGSDQPVVLARRTFNFIPGTIQPTDQFTTQVPHAPFISGSSYNVVLNMVYPINGTDGSTILVEGKVSTIAPITINA